MKQEQLYLFESESELCEEDLSGVEGDGLCEGEEVYDGELFEEGREGLFDANQCVVASL